MSILLQYTLFAAKVNYFCVTNGTLIEFGTANPPKTEE